VSSNEKIDDGNVLIEKINHQDEATAHQPSPVNVGVDSDVESKASSSEVTSEQVSIVDEEDVDDDVDDEEEVSVVCQVPRRSGRPCELPFQPSVSESEAVNLLDEEKLHDLKEAFMLFDLDQDGLLSELDLRNTFLTFGNDVDEKYVERMLEEVSNSMCNGIIDPYLTFH
jgi:rhodanese-related sulfurtransferase